MANEVFVDASYWIARSFPRDQWRREALAVAAEISGRPLVTTDGVLSEFLAGVARSGSSVRLEAAQLVESMLSGNSVHVLRQTRTLMQDGLVLYKQLDDKTLSLQDCISIVVMREREITEIATRDREFQQLGFRCLMLERRR